MSTYLQFTFSDLQAEQEDMLIAQLADAGFEGFHQEGKSLKAFIKEDQLDRILFHEIVYKYQLVFSEEIVKSENWNSIWESSFQPVKVDDFVSVRAEFHHPDKNVEHEIIITPKMSFGTGHHETTRLMILQMRSLQFRNKYVIDFGTGTGILAILAEKLGAGKVDAIDNDPWSIENAKENFLRNNIRHCRIIESENLDDTGKADFILANINKNVIIENIGAIVVHLEKNGEIILSGLLTTDEEDILSILPLYKLKLIKKLSENNWISLRLSR